MSLNCQKLFNVHYVEGGRPAAYAECFFSERDAMAWMLDQGEGEYTIIITYRVQPI